MKRDRCHRAQHCCHLVLKDSGLVCISSGQFYSPGGEKSQEIALDVLKKKKFFRKKSAWASHCFKKSKSIERYFLSKDFLV